MPKPKGWAESHRKHRDKVARAIERAQRAGKVKSTVNPWAVATARERERMRRK